MAAGEYMTPEQLVALQGSWDVGEFLLRESVGAPEWAQFVDRDGTAYSIEALAEEWLRDGAEEGELSEREVMVALSPVVTAQMIMESIVNRTEKGELRAVVDSPDDWK